MDYFPGPLASGIYVWSDFVFGAQNDRGPRSNLCEAAVDRLRLLN